jgi:ABC-type dipeptide/oligopeptide/nickel transport system permease subunit
MTDGAAQSSSTPNGGQARLADERGYWKDAAHRFTRNKLALIGLVAVAALIALAAFGPAITPYHYAEPIYEDANEFPSRTHLMGTDSLGRDVLSRVLYGARVSLFVGIVVQAIGLGVGVILGSLAGVFGGWVDFIVTRSIDVMSAFPYLLLIILIMVVLGSGLVNVIVALAIASWIMPCRLTRAQFLTLREKEFVLAARAIGASDWHIIVKHLLPNCLSPLIVTVTFGIPTAVFGEAGLSFIGIGVTPPTPSWGQMVGAYYSHIQSEWHLVLFPAVMIGITMLAFTLLGDGLRDALDPTQGE